MALYFAMIIFFTYFYVAITFNPEEVADNMKKYGGFIPGIRAGRPTQEYLALRAQPHHRARLAVPRHRRPHPDDRGRACWARTRTSRSAAPRILIIVGVGLDTVKQIESQLQQRNYEGFLR